MQMIPTEYKIKIPKTFSYPVTAKMISEALQGIPQTEWLKIVFSNWKRARESRSSEVPYEVLTAQYSGPSKYLAISDTGPIQGSWRIYVQPVPRPLKHLVQTRLIAEALPRLKAWFISNAHGLDREGGHRLTFSFDDLKNEITSEEFSNSDWKTIRI